jgi:methylmalonyl-CoA/ethylmalonyl-CoA epimerase
MRIHHVGYVVKDITKAMEAHVALGFTTTSEVTHDRLRQADIVFLENGGYRIELVQPTGPESVAWTPLKRLGPGPYHVCYESEDLVADESRLADLGFVRLRPAEPAPALGDRNVLFLMGRHTGMIELVEVEK